MLNLCIDFVEIGNLISDLIFILNRYINNDTQNRYLNDYELVYK